MVDYKKMYAELFNAATNAINILKQSQQATEEMYISDDTPVITILPKDSDNIGKNDDTSK